MNNNFYNLELNLRKNSVIQERMDLVSVHMFKQFSEYTSAIIQTNEVFFKMIGHMDTTVKYLKQAFSTRGVASHNIFYEVDKTKTIVKLNILWHKISFTIRYNDQPKALFRENSQPIFTGRIIAVNGDIENILDNFERMNEFDSPIQAVLFHEVASIFIPEEKISSTIMKIRHLGNKEFTLNLNDAPCEFLLKVIEIICGGGIYHEEGFKRNIKI